MQGFTIAAIAEELFISENTVKTHMRRLYAKLDIHKKQQLLTSSACGGTLRVQGRLRASSLRMRKFARGTPRRTAVFARTTRYPILSKKGRAVRDA